MKTLELRSREAYTQALDAMLKDALQRLELGEQDFSALSITIWQQGWSDSTCGFKGIGGQVLTDSSVALIYNESGPYTGTTDELLVYIRGQFAYSVKRASDYFWDCVEHQQLPGQCDEKRRTKLERT